VISVFRRDVDETGAPLGYHAALSDSSEPTFRGQTIGSFFNGQEGKEGTDRLSRNVGTELPLKMRNIPEECRSQETVNCTLTA
jgi:hypothetical protein